MQYTATKLFNVSNIVTFRHQKIEKLCNVMGQEFPYDPDESYELTGDNVKKILAIFMRFRFVYFQELNLYT